MSARLSQQRRRAAAIVRVCRRGGVIGSGEEAVNVPCSVFRLPLVCPSRLYITVGCGVVGGLWRARSVYEEPARVLGTYT